MLVNRRYYGRLGVVKLLSFIDWLQLPRPTLDTSVSCLLQLLGRLGKCLSNKEVNSVKDAGCLSI